LQCFNYLLFSDSLIFDIDKKQFKRLSQEIHLNSPSYGYYKEEINGDITSFSSLGCKNYAIVSKNPPERLLKVRGFTLSDSPSGRTFLTAEDMKTMINKFLLGESEERVHKQFQMKLNKNETSVHSSIVEKRYANDTFDKRFIYNVLSPCAESIPYGTMYI